MMTKSMTTNQTICGASFSLHPMSDQFVDIILGALNDTDTSKVWLKRDDVNTNLRGKITHVFDVTSAAFLHAAKTGEHVAFHATYSIVDCTLDTIGRKYLDEDDNKLNIATIEAIRQPVAAKFALYPLGEDDYVETILAQVEKMKQYVTVTTDYAATRIDGEAINVFLALEHILQNLHESDIQHVVMTVSISANSPSHQ